MIGSMCGLASAADCVLPPGAAAGNLGIAGFTPSGATTTFATVSGSFATGDCVQVDSNRNFVTGGSPCGSGGGGGSGTVVTGTTGNLAVYPSNGTTVAGLVTGTGVNAALGQGVNATGGCSFMARLSLPAIASMNEGFVALEAYGGKCDGVLGGERRGTWTDNHDGAQ